MMKVYTQTWYRGNNYGSVLQAYALQHTISDMGYACSALNYKPTKADMWQPKRNHTVQNQRISDEEERRIRSCQQPLPV